MEPSFEFDLECTDPNHPFKWTHGKNTLVDMKENEKALHPNEIKVRLEWYFINSEGATISYDLTTWFPDTLCNLVKLEKGIPTLDLAAYNQYLLSNTKFKILNF